MLQYFYIKDDHWFWVWFWVDLSIRNEWNIFKCCFWTSKPEFFKFADQEKFWVNFLTSHETLILRYPSTRVFGITTLIRRLGKIVRQVVSLWNQIPNLAKININSQHPCSTGNSVSKARMRFQDLWTRKIWMHSWKIRS